MKLAKQVANEYDLKGNGSHITLYKDLGGNNRISYNNIDYPNVSIVTTAAGNFASVVINFVAEEYIKYLSLLAPTVQLPSNSATEKVETIAIVSTHKTSIVGPDIIDGQLITYEVLTLKGTARFVLS